MLPFICCCTAHLSSFIRPRLILSFLLQLLLFLIALSYHHICCLKFPSRPFIKASSDTNPLGTQKLYFSHLEISFIIPYHYFPWCNFQIAQARTCCLSTAPRNHQTGGMDMSQKSVLHMHHILLVLAMSKRKEAYKRCTSDTLQIPVKFWPGQIQSWGDSVVFVFAMPGSY